MFDLPVGTKLESRKATAFRNHLLDNGFMMKQFSVYIRPARDYDSAKRFVKRMQTKIPDNGKVSFIYVTDRQYSLSEHYLGKNYEEKPAEGVLKNTQLILF